MHLLGVFYTSGENEKIVESLSDGVRFLVISMVMVSITDDKVRPTCLYAFLTAMAVVLILSCLLWLGILPAMIPVKGDAANCVIFHDHIKHNIFMSFTAFAAGLLARNPEAGFLPRTLVGHIQPDGVVQRSVHGGRPHRTCDRGGSSGILFFDLGSG